MPVHTFAPTASPPPPTRDLPLTTHLPSAWDRSSTRRMLPQMMQSFTEESHADRQDSSGSMDMYLNDGMRHTQPDNLVSLHYAHMQRPADDRLDVLHHTTAESSMERASVTVGAALDQGDRPGQEDDFVILSSKWGLGVVCDGHGGPLAAKLTAQTLPQELQRLLADLLPPGSTLCDCCTTAQCGMKDDDHAPSLEELLDSLQRFYGPDNARLHDAIAHVLHDCILDTDIRLFHRNAQCPRDQTPPFDGVGTTVTVQSITQSRGFIGWVGDSRSVLCDDGMAVALTTDHRPCNTKESIRQVEAKRRFQAERLHTLQSAEFDPQASAAASSFDDHPMRNDAASSTTDDDAELLGSSSAAITTPLQAAPLQTAVTELSVTRALGDFRYKSGMEANKPLLVSNRAEVVSFPITSSTRFVVTASDGLWDALSDDEVVAYVQEHLVEKPYSTQDDSVDPTMQTPHPDVYSSSEEYVNGICKELIDKARVACRKSGDRFDNITVMITLLHDVHCYNLCYDEPCVDVDMQDNSIATTPTQTHRFEVSSETSRTRLASPLESPLGNYFLRMPTATAPRAHAHTSTPHPHTAEACTPPTIRFHSEERQL